MHTPYIQQEQDPPPSDPDGWEGAPWLSLDRFCSVMPIYSAAVYSLAICFAFACYTFPAEVSPTQRIMGFVQQRKKKQVMPKCSFFRGKLLGPRKQRPGNL